MRELYIWEQNHLEECKNKNLFEGKNILDVGGFIPKEYVQSLGVKSWTCIGLWEQNVLNEVTYIGSDYKMIGGDIGSINLEHNYFDSVISTNCFEHIQNPHKAMENIFNILKPGGYLSALFGPIWSCHNGHHIWVKNDDRYLTFNDEVLPPFAHLIYSEHELKSLLKDNFSEEIINQVYKQNSINRLFYEDYIKIINNSPFIIHELRDWHKPVKPQKATLNLLKKKYPETNLDTVSLKILLQKPK